MTFLQSIEVSCQLDSTLYIGIMVLVQFVDPLDNNTLRKITIRYSESIHHPVIVNGSGNGLHFVTVFTLSGSTNLIGSTIIYQNVVYLSGFKNKPVNAYPQGILIKV